MKKLESNNAVSIASPVLALAKSKYWAEAHERECFPPRLNPRAIEKQLREN